MGSSSPLPLPHVLCTPGLCHLIDESLEIWFEMWANKVETLSLSLGKRAVKPTSRNNSIVGVFGKIWGTRSNRAAVDHGEEHDTFERRLIQFLEHKVIYLRRYFIVSITLQTVEFHRKKRTPKKQNLHGKEKKKKKQAPNTCHTSMRRKEGKKRSERKWNR